MAGATIRGEVFRPAVTDWDRLSGLRLPDYDHPALAAKLRERRVGLRSPVDIQRVLSTGDRTFIEAEARRMVETFRGGLILKSYPDLAGIGVEEEWDEWAYRAILAAIGLDEEEA